MSERIRIEFDRPYVLRMPASEAMMSIRKHGHLQKVMLKRVECDGRVFGEVLFWDEPIPGRPGATCHCCQGQRGAWSRPLYTASEVGLYREGDEWYGYLPDLSERPEEIQANVERIARDLDAIFTNAGAVTYDLGGW